MATSCNSPNDDTVVERNPVMDAFWKYLNKKHQVEKNNVLKFRSSDQETKYLEDLLDAFKEGYLFANNDDSAPLPPSPSS